jgi:hypothetical protein
MASRSHSHRPCEAGRRNELFYVHIIVRRGDQALLTLSMLEGMEGIDSVVHRDFKCHSSRGFVLFVDMSVLQLNCVRSMWFIVLDAATTSRILGSRWRLLIHISIKVTLSMRHFHSLLWCNDMSRKEICLLTMMDSQQHQYLLSSTIHIIHIIIISIIATLLACIVN